jgi:hypothetical protein
MYISAAEITIRQIRQMMHNSRTNLKFVDIDLSINTVYPVDFRTFDFRTMTPLTHYDFRTHTTKSEGCTTKKRIKITSNVFN